MIIDQGSGIYQAAVYLATYVAGAQSVFPPERTQVQQNIITMWGEVASCVERELKAFHEQEDDDDLSGATWQQLVARVHELTEQRDDNAGNWMGAEGKAAAMTAERDAAKAQVAKLEAALKLVRHERNDARANARILASSWSHDSRPPARAVAAALEYPIIPKPE